MAKIIRDEAYYQKRIEETENRRKRILDEDRKIKAEFEEWKKGQVIALLEKYMLTERISESTLWLFEKKFSEIEEELNKREKREKKETVEIQEEKAEEKIEDDSK